PAPNRRSSAQRRGGRAWQLEHHRRGTGSVEFMNNTPRTSRWAWLFQGVLGVFLAIYPYLLEQANTNNLRVSAGWGWLFEGFVAILLGIYFTLNGYRLLRRYSQDEKPDWRLPLFRILGPMFVVGPLIYVAEELARRFQ